jgi:O-antigen ligase
LPQFASAGFNSGLFTNCHNLILQLLAEMGLPITLAVVGGFAWVVWPFFSERAEAEGMLALGCMAVTLIHSMLEYPLWYLYFLAMLVVFASMSPARTAVPAGGFIACGCWAWFCRLSVGCDLVDV